jgi:hypothetical protein
MRMNVPFRLAILAAALTLCALAVACGGSAGSKGTTTPTQIPTLGPVTPAGTASAELQQYFQRAQGLDQTASQRLDTLSALLQTPPPTSESQAVIREYLRQTLAVDKDLRDGLQQLTPPTEAKTAHEAAIVALNHVIDIAQAAVDADDPLSFVTNPTAYDASTRLTQACEGLNRVAQSYGVSVTLYCGQQ